MAQTTGSTTDSGELEQKQILKKYLDESREALLWKLEGLTEKQARWPLVSSGNNLLGIVKHCANVEIGYFGQCLGREWPTPDEIVPDSVFDEDPQADWYATADESIASVTDLYRRARAFTDEAIDTLPLATVGHVPWWRSGEVTLFRLIVHMTDETARHAGHADILREQLDGAVGWHGDGNNVPDGIDWPAYVSRLRDIAERFPA